MLRRRDLIHSEAAVKRYDFDYAPFVLPDADCSTGAQ
jgi:hypothetical protein